MDVPDELKKHADDCHIHGTHTCAINPELWDRARTEVRAICGIYFKEHIVPWKEFMYDGIWFQRMAA